jgi:hypothetical protein
MNERERLIELLYNIPPMNINVGGRQIGKRLMTMQHIADHLLANGVIVLPMKLGQICFKPYTYRNDVDECRVSSITQKADGTFKIRLTNLRGKWVFEITVDEIGKTVFLTKEEAEKALAEREQK